MSERQKALGYEELAGSFREALRHADQHKLPERFFHALFRNLNELRTAIHEVGGTFLLYCHSNLAENGLSRNEDRFVAFARTGPGTRPPRNERRNLAPQKLFVGRDHIWRTKSCRTLKCVSARV
jgi:hypothetical protein